MTLTRRRWAAVLVSAGALAVSACAGSDSRAADPVSTESLGSAGPSTDQITTTVSDSTTTASTTASATPSTTTIPVPPDVRLNHVQMLGSHNSFHLVPEPTLFAGIEAVSAELARDIEYSHRNLAEQLADFGIRQFELDVFADPAGGIYANSAANAVVGLPPESGDAALDAPGFKVLHTQDFDFETTCLTLVTCLSEIDTWSGGNPGHLPIMVLVELKDLSVPEAAAAGYLIRTRTDSPTVDARANDAASRDAALLSGAHFLSTDYYEPSTYFDSPYVVALPGGGVARCNPVTAPPACRDDLLTEP